MKGHQYLFALVALVSAGAALGQEIHEDLVWLGSCRVSTKSKAGAEEFFLYRSANDAARDPQMARLSSVTVFERAPERPLETVTAEWVKLPGAKPKHELRFPKYWRTRQVAEQDCVIGAASKQKAAVAASTATDSPVIVRGYWVSPAVPLGDATQIDQLVAREDALPLSIGVVCEALPNFRECPRLKLVSTTVSAATSPTPNPLPAVLLPFSVSD